MDSFPTEIVRFELDGKSIEALPDETILQAAQRTGAGPRSDGRTDAWTIRQPCRGSSNNQGRKIRP